MSADDLSASWRAHAANPAVGAGDLDVPHPGGGLSSLVQTVFSEGGVLSRAVDHFVPRQGQTDMALAVADTIEQGGVLVVEAGTGVGKTFSYLVPALLSGEKVLLSTATKTLQDQLFGRDLPRLTTALGVPVRLALLKGRASYLCQYRLSIARHDMGVLGKVSLHSLASIELWSQATRTGDLAELPDLDERSALVPLVTSTRENCLGIQCPQFKACHVNVARRNALAADVVVINHHLFFADLAVRESGVAELLPTVRVVVFDEAHQLNEIGVQFLGTQLTTGQLLDLARDVLASGMQRARGLVDWLQVTSNLEHAARNLRLVVGNSRPGATLRWNLQSPESVDASEWSSALRNVQTACEQAMRALDTVSEMAPDLVRLHERALALEEKSKRFAEPCGDVAVRWLDVGTQLRLVESPLDIAEAVKTRLLKVPSDTAAVGVDATLAQPMHRSWIFTSATLGSDAKLSWFTEPSGLQDARILRVSSPFDYAKQAALYVPAHLPKPADPQHSHQLALFVAQAAQQIGGRTLVLTTSLRALRAIGDSLAAYFEASEHIEVLVQGQGPKRRLLEQFRNGNGAGFPGCVLVASVSFWEGVDVPGNALQMVVIDKLPFPPPNDPLVEARSRRLEREGRSSFSAYSMPEAAVALKQGAGRLIRSETDCGVLVIGDTRLTAMGYGKRLLASLPPMRVLNSDVEFGEMLATLAERTGYVTTASTTDPTFP